jgi:hypothetical protein
MRNVALILLMLTAGMVHGQTNAAQAPGVQKIDGTGTLLTEAPMFLLPDAGRTPLATLPAGTTVRVLEKEGDWLKVIQHDSFLGDRTAYVQSANVRVEATSSAAERAAPARATRQANAAPPRARARRPPSWSDRGYLSINGGYQATSNGFTASTTFTENVESATLTTVYRGVHPPVLDAGGTVRVWRNLGIGAAVTWGARRTDATVSAAIPHPFLFNTPRTVTGAVGDLDRREIALHVDASGIVPLGRKAQIAVFGGPSYFRVTQDLVTGVNTSSTYPFDTATFVDATTIERSQSRIGYNAGLDVTAGISKHVGVGGIVRYSRASLQFPVVPGQEVTIRAGGAQLGVGIRLAF